MIDREHQVSWYFQKVAMFEKIRGMPVVIQCSAATSVVLEMAISSWYWVALLS